MVAYGGGAGVCRPARTVASVTTNQGVINYTLLAELARKAATTCVTNLLEADEEVSWWVAKWVDAKTRNNPDVTQAMLQAVQSPGLALAMLDSAHVLHNLELAKQAKVRIGAVDVLDAWLNHGRKPGIAAWAMDNRAAGVFMQHMLAGHFATNPADMPEIGEKAVFSSLQLLCQTIIWAGAHKNRVDETLLKTWLKNLKYSRKNFSVADNSQWLLMADVVDPRGAQLLRNELRRRSGDYDNWPAGTLVEEGTTSADENRTHPVLLVWQWEKHAHQLRQAHLGRGGPVADEKTRRALVRGTGVRPDMLQATATAIITGKPVDELLTAHQPDTAEEKPLTRGAHSTKAWEDNLVVFEIESTYTERDEHASWYDNQVDEFIKRTAGWDSHHWQQWADLLTTYTELSAGQSVHLCETLQA